MFRPLWLALVAIGLWASLIPQVTYPSASSGELSNDALIAWPGWGVQQDLGALGGTVGSFQIWASAEPGGPEVSLHASLVDESTLEVIRQKSIVVTPAYIPVLRTLTFPSYVVPKGQRLLLQLQVAEFEENYVVFGLAVPQTVLANVAVNGVLDSGEGPLAFTHTYTVSGLRASILGDPFGRAQVVLAVAFSVLAVLSYFSILARLRRLGASLRRLLGNRWPIPDDSSGTLGPILSTPWYPWPAAAVPILHFIANNDIHFSVSEAATPLAAALLIVTGFVAALRILLKDWNRPALIATMVTVIFFSYGHVEIALKSSVDERLFFAGASVLGAVFIAGAVRTGASIARGTQYLNLVAALLLAFQVTSLAVGVASSLGSPASRTSVDDLTAHLLPEGLPAVSGDRPDIYYVILDAYGRDDLLINFDNSDFLHKLEARGFYVASEATSNYVATPHSLSSSLNMSYLHELGPRTPASHGDIMSLVYYNSLAAILKTLGYTYVHLESGHQFTSKAPLADVFASFSPSGVRVVTNQHEISSSASLLVSRIFVRELIRTTALRPIVESQLLSDVDLVYDWWSPYRALDMFDFVSKAVDIKGPKFIFAHISKPKDPATFDRYGNFVLGTLVEHGFRDSHDASVPNAYTGQLIYINALVLRMVDDILRGSDGDPIIVIVGDHNRRIRGRPLHPILAAFRLPNSGDSGMYPSISSVNHFRYILNVYFDLGITLLQDRTIDHSGYHWDFRFSAAGKDS